MLWAKKYDKCLECKTDTVPHVARGLCRTCYQTDNESRHKDHISMDNRRRHIAASISRDDLEREYVEETMSLTDLARKYNCTRQYVHKLMKYYDIKMRTKAMARIVALSQEKLFFDRVDESGNASRVFLRKIDFNRNFFKSWSPAMAYVLGVIFTDGNLSPSSKRDFKYTG